MTIVDRIAACPVCGSEEVRRLHDDWQTLDVAIPIIGCGNPWHYATRSLATPAPEATAADVLRELLDGTPRYQVHANLPGASLIEMVRIGDLRSRAAAIDARLDAQPEPAAEKLDVERLARAMMKSGHWYWNDLDNLRKHAERVAVAYREATR